VKLVQSRSKLMGAAAAGAAAMAIASAVGIAGASTAADPPTVRSLPSAAGTAQVGRTLTARNGEWNGTRPFTFSYQWRRCGTGGGNCVDVSGATAKTYALVAADQGHRIRVRVTAANSAGSSSAVSRPTAVVRAASSSSPPPGPSGQISLSDGKVSIPVTSVAPPQRLIVSGVQFSPSVVRSRSPFTARFRVTDTRGFVVRGALVYMIGLPYGRIGNVAEQPTGTDGWVAFQVQPTARLPLANGGALVVFVRARKPGENLLAGVSTRRLVQVRLGAAG
jgi:hypothetical protein